MDADRRSLSERVVRYLLSLLPFDFRRDYGREIEQTFRAQRKEAERDSGRMRIFRLWMEFMAGIFRTAPREHVSMLRQDATYALRRMRQNPGFAAGVTLTLALGVGANTAIFSVVHGVLLSPLPYSDGDRLVILRQSTRHPQREDIGVSEKELVDFSSQTRALDGLVEYHSMTFTLLGGDEAYRVQTGVVSWNFFDVFGVRPVLGRRFLPSDEQHGSDAVLLLSHGYWERAFRGDPNIVGRVFRMNNRPHTVIGVLPAIPQYPDENDVYMPVSHCPFRSSERARENRSHRMSNVFARIKPGVSLAAAQSDIAMIAASMHREYPESYPRDAGFGVSAVSLRETLTTTARPTLAILMATVGFVLLIACANVANLTLSRALGREREFAVRASMGASRARILRQTLTEGTILALAGGAIGLLFATASFDLLVSFAGRFSPRAAEVRLDGTVLLFTFGVALFTGLVFGSLPALAAGQDVASSLKEFGGHAAVSRRRRLARNGLVVAQVAFSLALLVGAGLMVRSLFKLLQVNPGFSPNNVLSARLTLNWSKYDSAEKARAFYDRLMEKLRETPGVVSAAIGTGVPLNLQQQPWMRGYRIEGRPVEEDRPAPQLDLNVVTPDYFRTLGIPLLKGRSFSDMDHTEGSPVAIINQRMARRDWYDVDPVGRKVSLDGGRRWITIVGVIGDVRNYGLDREPAEELYLPFAQFWAGGRLLLKTRVDPAGMADVVRATVHSIDPENPIDEFRTLEQIRGESVATPRTTAALLGIFAALALVITSAGLFGALALSVSQRAREIGVRLALGATPARVLQMVLTEGMSLVIVGLVLGAAASLMLTRMMSGLLFGIEPDDPLTFAAVCAVLMVVAAAACIIPARRAAAIDPMQALRAE